MSARAIMLLGTHSNAGKSLLATGFCRVLARRGINVAPFKAQNMSNNAGVTPQGGEMGRAQIVQAEAAGIAPHTDMNPVLLKPEANRRSQIVLNGKAKRPYRSQKLVRHQEDALGRGAICLRSTGRPPRGDCDGGRRQPSRDQPEGGRHRQLTHGAPRQRPLPVDWRHRPRRCLCGAGWHGAATRARRAQPNSGLHHQ